MDDLDDAQPDQSEAVPQAQSRLRWLVPAAIGVVALLSVALALVQGGDPALAARQGSWVVTECPKKPELIGRELTIEGDVLALPGLLPQYDHWILHVRPEGRLELWSPDGDPLAPAFGVFEQTSPSPGELRLEAIALFEVRGFYLVAQRN